MSVIDICKKNGLSVKEIEPKIYQNQTVNKPVNIDILKRSINNCTLFVSESLDRRKIKQGCYNSFAKVYYIMLGTDDKEQITRIYGQAKHKYQKVYISKFNEDKGRKNDIMTIFD